MINKPLSQVTADDLQSLLADGSPESKTLEYKLKLPLSTDKDKKEFLADASSFANAGGGDLIFGISAIDGRPIDIPGLADFNEDKDVLRLESSIRDGIEPRVQGVQFRTIEGFPNGPVLIIRLPRSWAAPHMVSFKGNSRFFTRSSAGKFQMDVDELRTAFEGAGRLPKRITEWRHKRIGRIISNDGPYQLPEDGRMIIHLVPVTQFDEPNAIGMNMLRESTVSFPPIAASGWDCRLNLDGLVNFDSSAEEGTLARGYTQVFRNGCIEAVRSGLVDRLDRGRGIPSGWYERVAIESIIQFLKGYAALNVSAPVLCFLTLHGVKGAEMIVEARYANREANPIDRDVLVLPDVSIEDLGTSVASALRPVFDMVWNSCGYVRSLNYDVAGNWILD